MKSWDSFEFMIIADNEKESQNMLQLTRPKEGELMQLGILGQYYKFNGCQILYVSDLHLDNILAESKCKSKKDVDAVLRRIGQKLDKSYKEYANFFADGNVVVILDGDITHSPYLFEQFTKMQYRFLEKTVIILGNHELWAYPGLTINEIVTKYRGLSSVPILHNEIILFQDIIYNKNQVTQDVSYFPRTLSYESVMNQSVDELSKQMLSARIIMLAGIGFSGCNDEFNANNGIYRSTLSREQEIAESEIFAELYDRFIAATKAIKDRVVIVATHMPIDDWKKSPLYEDGIIYLSGHTHKNFFHDDGMIRIYADNQNGYHGRNPSFKCIYSDDIYDPFLSYKDGIYEITKYDYILFYRAKKMSMQMNGEYENIYMLKKNNHYCFLARLKSGKLSILNGGRGSTLLIKDINYYYDQMEEEIEQISSPLSQYTSIQKQISETIKSFGGEGRIHGCIVDIDFYNHIYVNPIDLTVKGYYAKDMVRKWVYNSIPALLEEHSPVLYKNYLHMLENRSPNELVPFATNDESTNPAGVEYFETDIYRASRDISKMQKIHNNVLCYWNDNILDAKDKYIEYAKKRSKRESPALTEGGVVPDAENSNHECKKGASMKQKYLGITRVMKCGLSATLIGHINYKNITIQFEDGLIKHGVRMDQFMNGEVSHDN